jgi:psp operon transcriptional activator
LDRLSFEVLFLPPLRERGEDILLLANYFSAKMALECKRADMPIISDSVKAQLLSYPWPGNVRELKNVIERAVYRSDGNIIERISFNPFENPFAPIPPEISTGPCGSVSKPSVYNEQENKREENQEGAPNWAGMPLSAYEEAKEQLDRFFLQRALNENDANQKLAATALGLTYDQFRGLYRKYKESL